MLSDVAIARPAKDRQTLADPAAVDELTLSAGELRILPRSQQLISPSGRVQLTKREIDVLLTLVEQVDRVVRREDIYSSVWGGSMPYRDRAVDVYVRRIRSKLRTASPEFSYIHTHFAIGYRFLPQPRPLSDG